MDIFVRVTTDGAANTMAIRKFLESLRKDFDADRNSVTCDVDVDGAMTFHIGGAETDALGVFDTATSVKDAWEKMWPEAFGDNNCVVEYLSIG